MKVTNDFWDNIKTCLPMAELHCTIPSLLAGWNQFKNCKKVRVRKLQIIF